MPIEMQLPEHASILQAICKDTMERESNPDPMAGNRDCMAEYEAAIFTLHGIVPVEAFVNLKEAITPRDFTEAKTAQTLAQLPEGKRLDIIFARHPEDHS